MKKLSITLVLALAGWLTAQAQVAMKLELNRQTFLQYEQIYAKVTMRNDSGQSLIFGDENNLKGELNFEIVDPSGRKLVNTNPAHNPMKGVILRDGEVKEFYIALQPIFQMSRLGNYRIYAWIRHTQLKGDFKSPDVTFEIEPGVTIWERTVSLPDDRQQPDTAAPERTYALKVLYTGTQRLLYLTLTDDTRMYMMLMLGEALGDEKVRCDIGLFSRLHVLVPVTPKIFNYYMISPYGTVDDESAYQLSSTIPSLVRDPLSGDIMVAGGQLMPEADLPFDPSLLPAPEIPEL